MQRLGDKRHYCAEDLRTIQYTGKVGSLEARGREGGKLERQGLRIQTKKASRCPERDGEPLKRDIITFTFGKKFTFDKNLAAMLWIGREAVRGRHPGEIRTRVRVTALSEQSPSVTGSYGPFER